MPGVTIAANRLPFTVQVSPEGLAFQPSPGGMAAALSPARDHYDATWVGWHGLGRSLSAQELKQLALPGYARVVHLPDALYNDYYNGVANTTLWPALHGLAPPRWYSQREWESFLAVNRIFAAAIARHAKTGDTIWVHDFHLFLVPLLLRQAGVTNRVSFFLHIPFADTKLFRQLPNWRDILKSLQQTDTCGVQTTRDSESLLAAYRQAGLEPPDIRVVPVGIDYNRYATAHSSAATVSHAARIQTQCRGKVAVLSLSRLDYTKGILQQLQAISQLQASLQHPNLLYKLIVAPSRESLPEYRRLKNQIESLVAKINRRRPGLVDYEYRNVYFDELAAWYGRADVMVITPLIDGMNLVAKEYVAARQKPGVLVLSTTAGAAAQLTGALQVNPANVPEIQTALQHAITMPAADRTKRFRQMRSNVQNEDVIKWAQGCL